MGSVIYQCPVTRLNVQGWIDEDLPTTDLEHVFVPQICAACARTHLVHPVTGKVLAADDA